MQLFGQRKVADQVARDQLAKLSDELSRMQSVIRQLESEQVAMHDQVRRWMRRAVAAERAVVRNQEPDENGHREVLAAHRLAPETPAPPARLSRITVRGARARIAARRQLEADAQLLRELAQGPPPPEEPAPSADPSTGAPETEE